MTGKRASRRRHARIVQASTPLPARKPMHITDEARAWARTTPKQLDPTTVFAPYVPPRGVVPEGATIAMDSAGAFYGQFDANLTYGAWEEGQQFLGYPVLSILAQRAEYRIIAETFAVDMTRKWIELYSEEEDRTERIAEIEEELTRLNARDTFREVLEHDGLFGRGQIFVNYGDRSDSPELKTDIGDGQNAASREKCVNRRIKSLKTIEAVWTYPASYNSSDPIADDWYKPQSWFVMGREIHASRLLTFIGREVPDILKPAYAFGGLSMTQMSKPYVDAWIETDRGVTDIVTAFSTWVVKTNMAAILSGGGGEDLAKRLDMLTAMRTNRKVFAIDKEMEDFANVSAPLGTLDRLVGQKHENLASVAKMPLVKLTGISPSGLNASSEGELQIWDDNILSAQEALIRPNLQKLLDLIELGLWGEIDKTIKARFQPLREMTPKEQSDMAQQVSAAVVAVHQEGIIDRATAMEELKKSSDKTGIFASIPQEDIDEERANPTPPPGEGAGPGVPPQPGQEGQGGASPDQWAQALWHTPEGASGDATAEQWATALAAREAQDAPNQVHEQAQAVQWKAALGADEVQEP